MVAIMPLQDAPRLRGDPLIAARGWAGLRRPHLLAVRALDGPRPSGRAGQAGRPEHGPRV
jgi:hypothetical protein